MTPTCRSTLVDYVGVNTDGIREVLGVAVDSSVAEVLWIDFLRSPPRRGVRVVKLVISDAHPLQHSLNRFRLALCLIEHSATFDGGNEAIEHLRTNVLTYPQRRIS